MHTLIHNTHTKCICSALCWSHFWTVGRSLVHGGGFVSAVCRLLPLCAPPSSVSFIPLVSVLSSLIKQGTCSPNNLPPRSPGTTPSFHQHHCFSLLPPHVLLHHGNTCTHTHSQPPPPSLVPVPSVDRPAMCLFIRVPAATPLYVDSTWCCPFVWSSVLSHLPLTPGSACTITWVLVATGYPHWPVIDEPINGQCECVCAHMCLASIQPLQAHWIKRVCFLSNGLLKASD